MKEPFNQIATEKPIPTFEDFKRKCQTLLTGIEGECYLNNMRNYKPYYKEAKVK